MSAISLLASRMSRHVVVYATSAFITVSLSLVTVAVITRYLTPSAFGTLAVYILFAGLLTVLFNLGTLQGSFAVTFGATEDEDVGDDERRPPGIDKRRALGTALAFTFLSSTAGSAVLILFAPTVATLLSGDAGDAPLARLAAASGAAGAVWRLVSNVPRLERRPRRFLAVTTLRPLLVLGVSVPLVASGHGPLGALIGTAGGTAVAIVLGLLASRRSFRPALHPADVRDIVRFGRRWVLIIATFWVIQNGDLFILSRFASEADVGVYRVASRIGAVMSYFVGALMMAWTPLRRSSIFIAAQDQHGMRLGSLFTLYYVLASCFLLLALAVVADVLVRIAPDSYSDAAPLIPLTASGFAAYGLFIALNRTCRYPGRRRDYIVLAVLAALVFIVLALVLTPPLGAFGAAVSVTIGFAVSCAIMLWRSQRGPSPVPFEYRRMVGAVALAGACLVGTRQFSRLDASIAPLLEATALVAFVLGVIAFRVVPPSHLSLLKTIVVGILPGRRKSPARLRGRVVLLKPVERAALELVLRHRLPPEEIARRAGVPERALLERVVSAVRNMDGGINQASDRDLEIGAYLFSDIPLAERDLRARDLRSEGIDLEDLDAVETMFEILRSRRQRLWEPVRR